MMMQSLTTEQWLERLHTDGLRPSMQELMYYRTKLPAFARHQRQLPASSQSGALLSKTRGRGMEFDEVRHYQPGDDVRSIDWRVTARTGKAHTKLYREEKDRPVYIVVDLALTQLFGSQLLFKSVQACHLASALAWQTLQRGDKVGGIISNGWLQKEYKPSLQHKSVMHFLRGILEIHQDSFVRWQQQSAPHVAPLSDSIEHLTHLVKPGSLINLISDFEHLDNSSLEQLARLNTRSSVRTFKLYDPMEQTLPEGYSSQPLSVHDGERQAMVNLNNVRQRRDYQQQATNELTRLSERFKHYRLPMTLVSSAVALEQQWPELR
tara:strand:+ start:1867 stop:2832 length:966 start_codon:yes stop_codon:yes gene_type:complete